MYISTKVIGKNIRAARLAKRLTQELTLMLEICGLIVRRGKRDGV